MWTGRTGPGARRSTTTTKCRPTGSRRFSCGTGRWFWLPASFLALLLRWRDDQHGIEALSGLDRLFGRVDEAQDHAIGARGACRRHAQAARLLRAVDEDEAEGAQTGQGHDGIARIV